MAIRTNEREFLTIRGQALTLAVYASKTAHASYQIAERRADLDTPLGFGVIGATMWPGSDMLFARDFEERV
jgi:hypothetical protein